MLSSTEPMRKFESAAQNLEYQKLPRQMVTLAEGEQPLEQYGMVLFICNTIQYHAITCNSMECNAIPCNTMQYHAIPCMLDNC